MIAERMETDERTTGFWYPRPPIEPDVRSRWSGLVPALLMAVAVAGPSVVIAWLALPNPAGQEALTQSQTILFALGPAILVGLLLIPSLAIGRWSGRFTAVRGLVWLVFAALLFIVPGIGLAARKIVERPNPSLPDRPSTISTWVVGVPDVPSVFAAVFGAALIVGTGYILGIWAREIGRYAAIVAAAVSAVLGALAFVIYAVIDFGISLSAHSVSTPDAVFLESLPIVTWIAAPAVAVLAGAELWAEGYWS